MPPKNNDVQPLRQPTDSLKDLVFGETRQNRVWLVVLAAMVLAFALRPIPWADSTGAVYGPISFLCEGDWDLDEFPFLYERTPNGEHIAWSGSAARPDPKGQQLRAFAGLGTPLTALPGAALLAAWPGVHSEIAVLRFHQLVVVLSALAILWLTMAALGNWMGREPPWWTLPALFFGTVLWPQTRQTLWSNQSAMLGTGLFLWLAISRRDAQRPPSPLIGAMLGLGLGQALLSRPSTLLLTLPLLAVLVWQHRSSLRRWAPSLIAVCTPFVVLFLHDNQIHSGTPWTPPFAIIAADIAQVHGIGEGTLSGNPLVGSLGLLLSPSRGMLIFSPWLIVLLPGLWWSCRSKDLFRFALLFGVFTTFLLNACYVDWWGGDSWGPRRLQELLPNLLLLGLPSHFEREDFSLPSARFVIPLLALSIAIQGLGTFAYDSRWDLKHSATMSPGSAHVQVEPVEARMWTVREGVLVDSLKKAVHGELQFGWSNEITLATGWHYQPDLPPCSVLRVIDRFPYQGSTAKQ